MRPTRQRRRATAIVITVGLLAVLAVIGFGFAILMKLQHNTSNYFRASASIDMLSHAVVTYAIRDIRFGRSNAHDMAGLGTQYPSYRAGAAFEPTDSPQSPWYSLPGMHYDTNSSSFIGWGLYRDGNDTRYCWLKCNSYAMVHDVLGDRVAVSFAKVLDSAGKININDDTTGGRLSAVLDVLLDELLLNSTIDDYGTHVTASSILSNRPANGYATLDELKERVPGMTERRFDVLKHYVTIYSWPHEPDSVQSFTPYFVRPTASQSLAADRDDRRSPININTAPREVLVAILANVKLHSGTSLSVTKAREVADWILRKRDPENPEIWDNGSFSGVWPSWLSYSGYQNNIRKHTVRHWPVQAVGVSGWRSYPIGPFDTCNELVDFLYSLTDPDGTGADDDPFPTVITVAEAEAIIAAVCPNAMATVYGRDCWHMGYTRLRRTILGQQALRDRDGNSSNATTPWIYGKNDLATNGYTPEFCFSSRGRFEIFTRTFAFTKADAGKINGTNDYKVIDTTKRWVADQWRGYSVLIYDGRGKGQLRGIVKNDATSLTVAKWSTQLSAGAADRSRYYILGPGPLVDQTSSVTLDVGNPHLLTDSSADWEDDQWNGYRIVVHKLSGSSIAEATIQERVIIDTDGSSKQLVLSPELDPHIAGAGNWAYIILGSHAATAHDGAFKAYDVVHHTSQKDFAPTNTRPAGSTNIVVGPNPLRAGIPSAEEDGWVALEDKVLTNPGFRLDFTTGLGAVGGTQKGGNATSGDLFANGNLLPHGIYLPAGSGKYLAYSTSSAIVTANHDDGGFVSLWYRPDPDAMSGPARTLVSIKGSTAQADIRLQLSGTFLSLTVRQGNVSYGNLEHRNGAGGLVTGPVKFRKTPRQPAALRINVASTASTGIYAPWKAGEWHHIAFAWYECHEDQVTDDGSGDNKCDAGSFDPLDPQLDPQPQMSGYLRMWIDGTDVGPGPQKVDAFNIIPPTDLSYLQIGDPTNTAAGTIDGVAAYAVDRSLNPSPAVPNRWNMQRYYGSPTQSYGIYTSPTVTFPTGIAGKEICLGTVTWTAWQPWSEHLGDRMLYNQNTAKYPVRVTVTLGGVTSKEMPANGSDYQPVHGGGGPLVNSSGNKFSAAVNSLSYKVYLLSHTGSASQVTIPPYWQTPLLDDITITYLGPVSVYHWR